MKLSVVTEMTKNKVKVNLERTIDMSKPLVYQLLIESL